MNRKQRRAAEKAHRSLAYPPKPREKATSDAPDDKIAGMNTHGKTICLNMIVKNEVANLERCLRSVADHISCWVIGDTGSTDGTQKLIEQFFAARGIPGELHSFPFENFEQARNEALDRARASALPFDYILLTDADMELTVQNPAFSHDLTAAAYMVLQRSVLGVTYPNIRLLRRDVPARYVGVTHEYLDVPAGEDRSLEGISFIDHAIGVTRGNKYQRDIRLLTDAIARERDSGLIARYTFYLANTLRDSGDKEAALKTYLERVRLGHYYQEVFISHLNAARLKAELKYSNDEVIAAYMEATASCPTRAEALHGAACFCREKRIYERGYQFAKQGLAIPYPNKALKSLFVQDWIYEYGLLDEFAVNAYWTERYQDCLEACQRLLRERKMPEDNYDRVKKNAEFAAEKIRNQSTISQPTAESSTTEKPLTVNLGSFGSENLIEQHPLRAERALHYRLIGFPRVLVAILAKQKESSLPLYLECIEALDYPKSSIVLYIRTNNNTDGTERILRDWADRVRHFYAGVEFDATDVDSRIENLQVHEWNEIRFHVLGQIRNVSLHRAVELGCDFYFVVDVDNFIRRCTLRELVAVNLPIVAPLLRSINPGAYYSNYHAEIDRNGYYEECDQYQWILHRYVRGLLEVPVVHHTYLVRTDVASNLTYQDGSKRFEYVIFSDSARKAGIPQYLDNRQVYGYITFDDEGLVYDGHFKGGIDKARSLLRSELLERNEVSEQAKGSTVACSDSSDHD